MFRKPERKETQHTKPDHRPMDPAEKGGSESIEEAIRQAKARRMSDEPIRYLNWR